jgi:hypothetical protein
VPQKRYSCKRVVPIEEEPRHHLVIANEYMRALAVEIAPHDHTLCHHHPYDYLLYVAGDADIVNAARDEEPKKLSYRDGECELLQAGMVHVVENLGDAPFRNVVVEFLPKVAELQRGQSPKLKLAAGESLTAAARKERLATVRQCFEAPSASVYRLSIPYAAEIATVGPAVLASPYGHDLTLEYPVGVMTKIRRFNDLAWIAPGQSGTVRNAGRRAAQAVVLQLGLTG